jgi:hypothetical protein
VIDPHGSRPFFNTQIFLHGHPLKPL